MSTAKEFTSKTGKFRFDDFEADLDARSLAREGREIHLHSETFALLTILLASAPEPVSEIDLVEKLWPGVPVEDSNLGQHIFLLRRALSGAAHGEKVIVATSNQSYCLAAKVTAVEEDPAHEIRIIPAGEESEPLPAYAKSRDDERETARGKEEPTKLRTTRRPSLIASVRRSRRFLFLMAAAVALVLTVVVLILAWPILRPQSTRPLHLVIAGIQNATSDPQFDGSLRTALLADLRQSPHLILSPESRIVAVLVKVNTAATERAQSTGAIPQQLCSALKSDAYLTGELRRLGQKYLLVLFIRSCGQNKELAAARGIADSPESLLDVLDRAALSLRQQMGESRQSLASFRQPFFPSGNVSMPALKAYADGAALALDGKSSEAIRLLQRAVNIDHHFALAEEDLGVLQFNTSERDEGVAHLMRAYQIRNSVNPYDRFLIEARYDYLVTGDLSAALRNARMATESYPATPDFLISLASLQDRVGKSTLALDPARQAIALD
ncbi:MAG TPA: winged helix-turn-helix domain-containing protein, partial [Acidobacteriaceae bacterium]